MGRKTVGNDLDNAWIQFDHVTLPKSALLNRYADINGSEYEQKIKGMPGECVEDSWFFLAIQCTVQELLQIEELDFEKMIKGMPDR